MERTELAAPATTTVRPSRRGAGGWQSAPDLSRVNLSGSDRHADLNIISVFSWLTECPHGGRVPLHATLVRCLWRQAPGRDSCIERVGYM